MDECKPAEVAGYKFRAEENRTPRIPEAIIKPLLAWSLKYVTVFAPDIFAARKELLALEQQHKALTAEDALALATNDGRAVRLACMHISMNVVGRGAAFQSGLPGSARRDHSRDLNRL